MSNLKDLINEDLGQGIPQNPTASNEFVRKGDTAIEDRDLEKALMFYQAALRQDSSNRRARIGCELIENYQKAKNSLFRDGSQAIQLLRDIVAINPDFMSAKSMLRTSSILLDDWQTLSEVGIPVLKYWISGPGEVDRPDIDLIRIAEAENHGLGPWYDPERIDKEPMFKALREKEAPFLRSQGARDYKPANPNLVYSGHSSNPFDGRLQNQAGWMPDPNYHGQLTRLRANPWVVLLDDTPLENTCEVWFRVGDRYLRAHNQINERKIDPFGHIYGGTINFDEITSRPTHIMEIQLSGEMKGKIEAAYDSNIDVFPFLLPVWETPFQMEYTIALNRQMSVPARGLGGLLGGVDYIGYLAHGNFRSSRGKIWLTSSGIPTDWEFKETFNGKDPDYHFHNLDFKLRPRG